MDSVTQIALGAAVGEAVLGRKVGGKAAAWGAVLGTLPDLDVLAYPLLTPAGQLSFHRGPTHALLFAFVVAPVFGALILRLHRKDSASWKEWTWLAFLALFTHPVLDAFTAYGTQLLLPFSNAPVAWNTISIIDPMYTVPLLIGVIGALVARRDVRARKMLNYGGLAVSSTYLLFTIVNKLHVASIFETELTRQNIDYDRLEVMPTLFNNVLWTGLAAADERVHVGLYSLLDNDEYVSFRSISKNRELVSQTDHGKPLSVLFWFSRGLFTIESEANALYFDDLHIGRSDFFLSDDGASIFRFKLETSESGEVVGFESAQPSLANRSEILSRFSRRVLGDEDVEVHGEHYGVDANEESGRRENDDGVRRNGAGS